MTSRGEWFAAVAASFAALATGHQSLALDTATGDFLAVSDAMVERFEGWRPRGLDDLVDRGIVSRVGIEVLLAEVAERRHRADPGESSDSWTTELRVHPPAAEPLTIGATVVVHRRPRLDAEVATVLLDSAPTEAAGGDLPDEFTWWMEYDQEMRVIGVDAELGRVAAIPPAALVGVLGAVLAHPEDLPEVLPVVLEVLQGRRTRTTYTVRSIAAGGRWLTVQVELAAMVTAGQVRYLSTNRVVTTVRRRIPPDTLTARELEVVRALFDGLRVAAVAARDGVAEPTVRKQLASTYRKLDVSGQAELLATYHRPE